MIHREFQLVYLRSFPAVTFQRLQSRGRPEETHGGEKGKILFRKMYLFRRCRKLLMYFLFLFYLFVSCGVLERVGALMSPCDICCDIRIFYFDKVVDVFLSVRDWREHEKH